MTAKFRTKANAAHKKSKEINCINLSIDEVKQQSKDIVLLYQKVVSLAKFSLGELQTQSFIELKQNLGDAYEIYGYYLGKELVGFASAFITESSLDAHYVGFDNLQNREYALYQRMLYDMVGRAIELKLDRVIFGRTAEELKSTLGAKEQSLKLYIRHRNHLSNKLLKHLIGQIKPASFEARYPFKAEFSY